MNKHIVVYRLRENVPGVGKKLARVLGAAQATSATIGKRVKDGHENVIVNYGNSRVPKAPLLGVPLRWLNHPSCIKNASDKLESFKLFALHKVPCVTWTTNPVDAAKWLAEGHRVFARTTTVGKKGQGIVICEPNNLLRKAPLWTKEFRKHKEHRVHVFQGKVIDVTQKKRMTSEKVKARGYERQKDIRNKANGWVFAHQNILWDNKLGEMAIKAIEAVGLDFGGVDILSRWKGGKLVEAVVCEVNSAPGMSKSKTFEAYINSIKG